MNAEHGHESRACSKAKKPSIRFGLFLPSFRKKFEVHLTTSQYPYIVVEAFAHLTKMSTLRQKIFKKYDLDLQARSEDIPYKLHLGNTEQNNEAYLLRRTSFSLW